MPNTRRGTALSKVKAKTSPAKKASAKQTPKKVGKPTAYAHLYAKLEAKKRKLGEPSTNVNQPILHSQQGGEIVDHNGGLNDPIESSLQSNANSNSAIAKFQEDDCYVKIEVEGVNNEFPSPSEDEQ